MQSEMSNVQSKQLNKYVVLTPAEYSSLILLKVDQEHLEKFERDLIVVLNNKKMTLNQRLKSYQDILFKSLLNRFKRPLEPSVPVPHGDTGYRVTPHQVPGTGYPLRDTRLESVKHEVQTQTSGKRSKSMGTSTDDFETNDFTAGQRKSDLLGYKHQLSDSLFEPNEEYFLADGENESVGKKPITLSSGDSTSANENLFLDYESEQQAIFDRIRRESDPEMLPKDFRRLTITNMNDPEKDYVIVQDNDTLTQYTIEKSPDFVLAQRKVAKKTRLNEAEQLTKAMTNKPGMTPVKSRLRSGTQSGSGTGMRWIPFEELMKK